MDLNLTAASSELSNPPSITSGATPLDSTIEFRPDVSTPAPISSAATHIATAPSARIASISSSRSGPTASGYSEATEGVLARLQEQAASGSYNEAREHILSSIVTSDRLPVLPPITNGSRGRGRPRGSGKRKDNSSGSAVAATSTPGSGRRGRGGRPRGRPRGGGRTGKRKRADSEESELSGADGLSEDSEDESAGDSDGTSTNINLPTLTKSGRKINRPAPFVPVISSPNSGPKKKRAYRRNPENAVCKSCERGHSPTDNAIVFCDGCGSAYHQYCHTPPIGKDVVQIPEMEWFCVACVKGPAGTITPVGALGDLSTGQNMSVEEVSSPYCSVTLAVRGLIHGKETLSAFGHDAGPVGESLTTCEQDVSNSRHISNVSKFSDTTRCNG